MIANQIRLLTLAFDRFTRFRLPPALLRWALPEGLDPRRALRYAPLMSALVGVYAALAYLVFAQILPHPVALILAVITAALIGGAPHERGLASLLSFGPGGLRRHETAIITVVLLLILRLQSLIELDPSWVSLALVTSGPLACGLAVALSIGTAAAPGVGERPVPLWSDRLVALVLGCLPAGWACHYFDQHPPFLFAIVPACVVAVIARVRFGSLIHHRLGRPTPFQRDRFRQAPLTPGSDEDRPVAQGRRTRQEHRRLAAREQTRSDLPSAVQQCAEAAFLVGLLAWWSLIGSEQVAADASSSGEDEGGDGGDESEPSEEEGDEGG